MFRFIFHRHPRSPPFITRQFANLNRPAPPPLPPDQQREFEQLIRQAQSSPSSSDPAAALHPDARQPVKPEFDGDTNPLTGEMGGPKREPVKTWVEGDWSFQGRVSDF